MQLTAVADFISSRWLAKELSEIAGIDDAQLLAKTSVAFLYGTVCPRLQGCVITNSEARIGPILLVIVVFPRF